ncbi:hypothetical protein MKW98_014288 [Papaver atlanticum]|uniref:Uncharacterized protein n=1 Tax=Papaver atlanticum TaxID=357466 RepID=A0AAD4SY16_9MAGN|nr:hypothetical protein MKW98_014288 [Papaver atlanticum]
MSTHLMLFLILLAPIRVAGPAIDRVEYEISEQCDIGISRNEELIAVYQGNPLVAGELFAAGTPCTVSEIVN